MNLLMQTKDGATYLQAIISVIALVGVIGLWCGLIREGLEK